jgi:hypothetical protein
MTTDDRFRLPHPDVWAITSSEAAERMRAVAEATRGFPSLLMLDAAATSVRTPVEQTGYASEVVAEMDRTWEALGLIALLRPPPSRRRRLWLWLTLTKGQRHHLYRKMWGR